MEPRPRLFLVEDSEAYRRRLELALGAVGQVEVFAEAEGALAALAARPPDLIVTDVILPGASGIELCRAVRSRFSRLELPVVLVSSLDQLDDVARGYEAGADDYLLKPIDAGELARKARQLLERRGSRVEAAPGRRYELLDALAEGQVGAIHRARRRDDGTVVALKLVPSSAGEAAVARLLAEAELLRGLEEVPGIVRVHDVGMEGGHAYYAMDLVEGETLRARLRREGRLPVPVVALVGRALATSLAGLALAGVVHGDVKPSNVQLGPAGPVLIDFGLAHPVHAPRPERGGTLAYLAPEVVRGEPATPRSDIYGLAVLLHECLTGALPYAATGDALKALKVEGTSPDLEPLLGLDAPPGIVAVIEEGLEPDPERRTASPTELAVALLPYAARI